MGVAPGLQQGGVQPCWVGQLVGQVGAHHVVQADGPRLQVEL